MFLTLRRSVLSSFWLQASLAWLMAIFISCVNKLPVVTIKPFSPLESFFLNSSLRTYASSCIQFVQETFVHVKYVPFQLPSVGLSTFHRNFLCTRRTYLFNYQMWSSPLSTWIFCAHNIHTISTTKCGAFCFSQEFFLCTRRTYHGYLTILEHIQARPNYLHITSSKR